jgi:hypothetical protein
VAALLIVSALVYAIPVSKNNNWGIAFRVCYTLATVAALPFVWLLNYWNWLGWRY